jgi:hypothetical protein
MTISTPTTRPGRWISILLIVLGAIGVVYGVGSGVVRGFASHAATSDTLTVDAAGVEQLQIDSSATAFEVRFGDVEEATLDVASDGGPVQQWNLSRSGDTLVVDTDRRWRWVGFGIMFGDRVGEQRAVLTLPAALERQGLGLETEVSAGSFEAAGSWGAASIDLSAGSADLSGTAESLFVSVSAGEARLDVETGGTVTLDVSAGRIIGALTGEQPSSIDAQASAGSIDLTIPDGEYAVTEQASVGDSDVRVIDDPGATSTIDVDVSAGNVTLRGEER